MPPLVRSRGPVSALALISLLLGAIVALATPANAMTVAGSLSVSPGPAIAGEQLVFTGSVPPKKSRPVELQRRNGVGLWVGVDKGTTVADGSFTFRIAAPSSTGSTKYRVFAKATKLGQKSYDKVATPTVTHKVVDQTGALTVPEHSSGQAAFAIHAVFAPPRKGRPVTLQRQGSAGWSTVATGAEDADGSVSWAVSGSGTYRAVAKAANGAAKMVVGPQMVRERPPEEVWLVTDDCRDVVWVGARGSGQGQQDSNGLGGEVDGAWQRYRDDLDGVDAGFYAVIYPAVAADLRLAAPNYRDAFAASIDTGVIATLEFLRARAKKCKDEHYVLAGFSQGAIVMHRALVELTRGVIDDPFLMGRIDGVLAIADGDKRPSQGGQVYSTADPLNASGISWAATWATSSGEYDAVDAPVPDREDWPSTRFHDVCTSGDAVCDMSTALAQGALVPGMERHGNAYRANGSGDDGGAALADVLTAADNIAATTRSWHAWQTDPVGAAPAVTLDPASACSRPKVTLDNTLGKVDYQVSARVSATYQDFTTDPSTPVPTYVQPGAIGSAWADSVDSGPLGPPKQVVVEYFWAQVGVPYGDGYGGYRSHTIKCTG